MLTKNLRKFKLITFDCTNTLLYFKNPPELQYLETAAAHGISEDVFDKNLMKENFRQQFKEMSQKHPNFGRYSINWENWWQKLVVNVLTQSSRKPQDRQLLETIATKLIHQFKTRDCWGKFEKSNELITALKKAGKTVGAISNFDPRLHDVLNDMELPKLDFVLTSYEAGVAKPNPEIFYLALKASKLNIDPSEALHIGNEVKKDFDAAINAGWSAVLINSDVKIQPSFKDVEQFWNAITSSEINLEDK